MQSTPKARTLVRFGDSITASMNVWGTTNLGVEFDTWETALRRVWMIPALQPTHIVIMLGINDLHLHVTISDTVFAVIQKFNPLLPIRTKKSAHILMA